MKFEQSPDFAKSHSIDCNQLLKIKLIKLIQFRQGNFDCLVTANPQDASFIFNHERASRLSVPRNSGL